MNTKIKITGDEVIKKLLAHDNSFLHELYRSYFNSVRNFVILNSGTMADAEDTFQEAIVILYRKAKEEGFKLTSDVGTFIYAIAKHIWYKSLEKSKKVNYEKLQDVEETSSILDSDVDNLILKNERLKLYREYFEKLADDCKKVLRMFINKVSVREITSIMGYGSEQYTKNKHSKCKKLLISKIRESTDYKSLSNG